jgi:transposase-like protein
MVETTRLGGDWEGFELEFVERVATPKQVMKLGIQLHLAGLSLSDTVSVLEISGIERVRSNVHNWMQKADL